jgi:hypothetical protein
MEKGMNLNTTYLGLTLRSPLVPSASPLSEEINNIKRMEDAGAAAVERWRDKMKALKISARIIDKLIDEQLPRIFNK